MSVLVGIVSRNRSEILPKAIESALLQDYSPLQVSVFDDNSSDDTVDLEEKYPHVSWEFSKENKGYLYARNNFMRETSANYFCSLDDDSWFLEPSTLKSAIHYLESHPLTAAIAFDILSPDRPVGLPESLPFEVANFIGCGHVLRMSAVREVGYYDPNPSFYGGEEKDLCIKLINKGYEIALMPGKYVWHDKTNIARDESKQHSSGVCNDLVFAYRRLPLLFLFPGLFFKVMSHLRFGVSFRKGAFFFAGLLGIVKFFALLLSFSIKRKAVSIIAFKKYRGLINEEHVKVNQLMQRDHVTRTSRTNEYDSK
ncbi:hypothetical protein BH09BAC3_BH09BAC3_13080 [soil metagenome]